MKMVCSRCHNPIEDGIVIKIVTHYEIFKETDQGFFSQFNNASEETSEYLCGNCFNKYCECMDSLNKDIEIPVSSIATQVVNDIQYGDV